MKKQALMLCLAMMCTGCLPIAFAVPPARLTADVGMHYHARDLPEASGVATHFDLRGAVYPFQLVNDPMRYFDVGLGYAYSDNFSTDLKEHGPFLDLSLFFADVGKARLGTTLQGRLLSRPGGQTYVEGFGTSLQLFIEITDFEQSSEWECSSDGCLNSFLYGEVGVGWFVEVGHERFLSESRWEVSTGVILRIPSILAFGFVFWKP